MAVEITEANYKEIVENSDKLVMIDFWAEWCGPCRTVGPIVEEVANEYSNIAVIGKCDVDENSEIAVMHSIRNIPTLLFIKNGNVVDKLVGAVAKAKIVEKLEQYK